MRAPASNDLRVDRRHGQRRPSQSVDQTLTQSSIEPPVGPHPIAPPGENSSYPLTSAQQRIWFFKDLAPDVPLYNESETVRLIGELHADALEQALNAVVARHDALRTTIRSGAEGPVAIVHENCPLRIRRIDLSEPASAHRPAELDRVLTDELRRPFQLEIEPGFRATIVRLGPRDHVLMLIMHHVICDFASDGIVWREMSSAYRSIVRGEPIALGYLPAQFGDYAVWQNQRVGEERLAGDLAFWEENLRGAPELIELPSDRPRPSVQSWRGKHRHFRFDGTVTEAIRKFSRQEKTSLFTVFAAALNTLLYRYTGSEDILLGIPVSDRRRPELETVIGLLLDTQVLRTGLSADLTFRALLARMRKGLMALYRRREVPFEQVVNRLVPERSLSHSPLFQVMISWRDQSQSLSSIGLHGLVVESVRTDTQTSKFDLTFFVTDNPDEMWLEVEYNTDLFDDDRIARMFGHYQTLLEGVAADPERRLEELPVLTDAERQQLIVDWNATDVAYPQDMGIHNLFEAQADRTPDAVAVVFGDRQATYRELNDQANRLARHLKGAGVEPGALVGICVERSIEMVTGLIGILKAGGAYMPIDPAYPVERLRFMLRDSGASLVLTQSDLRESLPADCNVLCLDTDWPKIATECAAEASTNPRDDFNPENPAYIIYTSGSTGQPKGVEITHRSVVNLLRSMSKKPGLTADDTMAAVTTLSFDIAALELFLPLSVGAKLVIASREQASAGALLLKLLTDSRPTVIQATPVTFRMLIEAGWTGGSSTKVLCGGEALSRDLADQILARSNSLWNMYGPTETTIWSSAIEVQPGDGPVPIGGPIDNTQFHVLDAGAQLVPTGVPGELYIGGAGLARGYFNRPELTAEKFIANTIDAGRSARLYKTGDLVRRRVDGALEYIGRLDGQVKIRGFRIELGEIEAALKAHPGVGECVVTANENEAGDKRLAAYVVPANRLNPPSVGELREWLKLKVPEYMVPAAFVVLAKLPLTLNRKIDRKALPAPKVVSESEYVAPRTPMEEVLAEIWSKLLGIERVGINDNFFDLGGTSMLAARLGSEVLKSLNQRISVPEFFRSPTISWMASVLETAKRGELDDGRKSYCVVLRAGMKALEVVPEDARMIALQTGKGRPLFIVDSFPHFIDVVRLLGCEQPVLSVVAQKQARASTGYSVAEEAAGHVRTILECQPSGPYMLGGSCAPGIVAYEVAQQLQSLGHEVGLLALFDSHNPEFVRAYSAVRTSLAFNRAAFKRKSWNEVPGWVAEKIAKAAVKTLRSIPGSRPEDDGRNSVTDSKSSTQFGLLPAHGAAIRKYRPKPFAGGMVVFRRPPRLGGRYLDETLGWRETVRGEIDVIELGPSRHLDLFKSDSDRNLVAQKLRKSIAEATANGLRQSI